MISRLGIIDFLHSRPILHAIESGRVRLPRTCRVVKGTPSDLNARLLAGKIEVGFVSSIAFARRHRELVLLPGISVNSRGFVDSVALFHRDGLRALDGGVIAVTPSSETSDVLLRILLEHHFRIRAGILKTPVDAGAVGGSFPGALLIGDDALTASREHPDLAKTDLGEAWQAFAGVPMVFAVLAARRDFAEVHPRALRALHARLLEARDWGVGHLDVVAAAPHGCLSLDERAAYFRRLDFAFDEEIRRGLLTFWEYAYKIGALEGVPQEAIDGVG